MQNQDFRCGMQVVLASLNVSSPKALRLAESTLSSPVLRVLKTSHPNQNNMNRLLILLCLVFVQTLGAQTWQSGPDEVGPDYRIWNAGVTPAGVGFQNQMAQSPPAVELLPSVPA